MHLSSPRRAGVALAAATGLVLAPAAIAQKPPKPPKNGAAAISLDAKPGIVVFSSPTTLSGAVTGPTTTGVDVRLEQDDTLPLGDSFRPSGMTVKTTGGGQYTFSVRPAVNTQYRTVAKTSPDATSPARLVRVRSLVGLKLSDSTPRAGTRVRFSGSVLPAHDGAVVRIQRRSSTGGWVTVSKTALRDAGTTRSTYSRRLRVSRDGVYRVTLPADADHLSGFSRQRRVSVG